MKIKLYGERNTGTNYIEQLIKINCMDNTLITGVVPRSLSIPVLKMDKIKVLRRYSEQIRDLYFKMYFCNNYGWKHSIVNAEKIINCNNFCNTFFLCILKNPYSWILSIYNKPYHIQSNKSIYFNEFITKPWKTVERENAPKYFNNIIHMWNEKAKSYYHLKKLIRNVKIVKYEDVLFDYNILIYLLKSLNINVGNNNIHTSTKDINKDFKFYYDYYINEKWKTKYQNIELEVINTYLDIELMKKIGYEKFGP
ncbi:MAG: hypothetical protein ACOCVF_03285 [bacterium]